MAKIVFGVLLGPLEDLEVPWNPDDKEDDREIEDWWRIEQGYVATSTPFDSYGNRKSGLSDEDYKKQVDDWYDERKAFDAAHPCPYKEYNAGSGNYPVIMLSPVSIKGLQAYCGTPLALGDEDFARLRGGETAEEDTAHIRALEELTQFCEKYDIQPEGKASWYLCAYGD